MRKPDTKHKRGYDRTDIEQTVEVQIHKDPKPAVAQRHSAKGMRTAGDHGAMMTLDCGETAASACPLSGGD